jgi:hypothetical protein
MRRAVLRFSAVVAALATFIAAVGLMPRYENAQMVLLLVSIFFGLPLLILTWVDLGQSLRKVQNPSRIVYLLGWIFAVPQVIFAGFAICCGVLIVGSVLYDSFIHPMRQYTAGFLAFGIGPALIWFGIVWLRRALSRSAPSGLDPSRSNNRWRGP